MTRALARLACVSLAVLGAGGCADKTALKIEVSSTLAVPTDVDRLEILVVGDATGQMADERFDLATPFPHSLSVRPGRDPNETLVVTVTARKRASPADPTGALVVRRVVHERFVEGEDRTIVVDLPRACVGVTCPEGVDCVDGRCGTGCTDAAQCNDGDPCNGVEQCESGRCVSPGVADCDDRVECTVDSCVARACVHTPDDARCTPGNTCDATRGCGGRPCAGPAECDDGRFCTGVETCEAGACRSGVAPSCDDADDCTTDACSDARGACTHTTRDVDMDGHGTDACPAAGGVPNDDCDDGDDTVAPGQPEACNGRDDDCDTTCDDGYACCRAATTPCTTSCGSAGMQICDGTCTYGACNPPAETCNGDDDDCDGICDNGVGCCAGTTTTCMTACGSSGTRPCSMTCAPGACTAPAETCNGIDDDCDTMIDEGFACAAGTTTPCTTTCMSTGTRACASDCTMGACTPPAEVCGNSVDDDCDGMTDEGCTASCTGACPGATPIAAPGGRLSAALGPDANAGTCGGGGGSETLFSFTLTSESDVFVTTHNSAIDTVLYVRACSCTGTEVGCNDDADGVPSSMLQLSRLPGGTYTVFVDTKAAMSATISLDLFISPVGAAGDRCGRPLRFAGAPVTGSTCGLASDWTGDCAFTGSFDGPDVVYYVVRTGATRSVTFSTCSGCTDFDTTLDVRRVCSGAGMSGRIRCDDDSCASSCDASGLGRQAQVTANVPSGITYVVVDGRATSCGNYELRSTAL